MSRFTRTPLCLAALLVSVVPVPLTGDGIPPGPLTISAMAFTPGANYDLSQIDLAMTYILGTNSFTLDLVGDYGGRPGSTILESWTVSNAPPYRTCCIIDTVTSTSGLLLQSGYEYWLEAVPGSDSDTREAWNYNSIGATGLIAQSEYGDNDWFTFNFRNGAFDVLGNTATSTASKFSVIYSNFNSDLTNLYNVSDTWTVQGPLGPAPEPSAEILLATALALVLVFFLSFAKTPQDP
jgi:hypothetical protein